MEFENLYEQTVESKSAMDEELIEEKIVNPMTHGLPSGYWFSAKSEENGHLIYEFITGEGEGPKIEIHVVQE
jgi:hypothetical protein